MIVGELEFLSDVLLPSGIEGDQFWEKVSPHGSLNHVRVMEGLLVVISFHSSTCSFNILAVVDQHFVQLLILIRDLLPIVDDWGQIDDAANGKQFGHREDPSVSLPSNVGDRVLDEPAEVFESSFFVSLVDWFLAQPELFQLPIVLLSHRPRSLFILPVGHFESLKTIGSAVIHIQVAVVSLLRWTYLTLTPSSTGAWRTQR